MEFFETVINYFAGLGDYMIRIPLIALISYLLGSINTSIIVSKYYFHKDIRDY